LPSRTKADAYLSALSQIESGDNDHAHGRAGEVGRFQCLRSVWVTASRPLTASGPSFPISQATNPIIAAAVAVAVIERRTGKHLDQLTPEQVARAWHCPNARHLNREQRDYVKRFQNLTQGHEVTN
jgi:hypothetical protein